VVGEPAVVPGAAATVVAAVLLAAVVSTPLDSLSLEHAAAEIRTTARIPHGPLRMALFYSVREYRHAS
jgi:hypothetical protein